VLDLYVGPHTIPPQAALPNPALPATLFECVQRAADLATHTDGVRFADRKEREIWLPWAEILDRALRSGAALRDAGVHPGDRVALVLPTDPIFLDAFFGVLAAGAVPAPLSPPLRLGRLAEWHTRTSAMIRACGASAVIADSRCRRVLGETVGRCTPRLGVLAAESLHRHAPAAALAVNDDDLAMVQFTSGATHPPKPVGLSHRQILANTDAILDFMPLNARDPDGHPYQPACVSWLPLHHDMGLIGCLFVALRRPGPLTLLSPDDFLQRPALWLRAISRHRGTLASAPNFAYALCVERIKDEDLDGVDLSSWRFALSGAEPVSPRVLRRFHDRFASFGLAASALTPTYGLSEASLAVTCGDPRQPFRARTFSRGALARGRAREITRRLGVGGPLPHADPRTIELASVGRPLMGYGVEIRGSHGEMLPTQRVGRLWVHGPSLMRGYLDQRDQPIVDGWLDTNDLGFIYQGDLYVTGRAEDAIVLGDTRHSPHDIESALDDVDGVRAGCSAAVSEQNDDGETLIVFVEYRTQRAELAEDCRRAVRTTTGLDPSLVVLLAPGTLPRTSSGKIRRRQALVHWKAGTLTPPAAVTPWLIAGAMARSALGYLRARGRGEEADPVDGLEAANDAAGTDSVDVS